MENNTTKEELTEFEKNIIYLLRKKDIKAMEYPGNLTIHFDFNKRPVSVEKREIHS